MTRKANGLKNKIYERELHLEKYNIAVAAIQESLPKEKGNFSIRKYNIYREEHEDGRRGRIHNNSKNRLSH